jgi:hypothetical protein
VIGLGVHQAAQRVPPAKKARTHGADWDAEDLANSSVGHPLQTNEQDHRSLLRGQLTERPVEIAQFEDLVLVGRPV